MSRTAPTSRTARRERSDVEDIPPDLVCLKRAAYLACMSRDTLIRRAAAGLIREWRRSGEGERGRFYSEAEVKRLRPRRAS